MKSTITLAEAFIKIGNDKKRVEKFLNDLLTPVEYRELSTRLEIVRLLNEGMPHKTIAKNLKVGVATVTRGSKALAESRGGFTLLF
jgi:TrpR family trp operon transcriptional repressor